MNSLNAKENSLSDKLETLVDKNSLGLVLAALSRICSAKSEHIQMNWQDTALARAWDAGSSAIDASVKKVSKYGI